MAGGALDPRLLSSRKIERLDCPPIPVCIALLGGREVALGTGQNRRPPQPGHKGATPRFIPRWGWALPAPQEGRKRPQRGRHGGNSAGAAPQVRSGPLGCPGWRATLPVQQAGKAPYPSRPAAPCRPGASHGLQPVRLGARQPAWPHWASP